MRVATLATVFGVATVALLLSACSTSSSWVTITYQLDGTRHSETINPDTVRCDDHDTTGVSAKTGQFAFHASSDPDARLATVAIIAAGPNKTHTFLYFEGKKAEPDSSTAGRVTVAKNTGTVVIIDNWTDDVGAQYNPDDGTKVAATVSAEIHCS